MSAEKPADLQKVLREQFASNQDADRNQPVPPTTWFMGLELES